MPKVESFQVDGLILKFNSLDHLREHFHVSPSDRSWEVRVYFLECTEEFLAFDFKRPKDPASDFQTFTRNQKRRLLTLILEHRVSLLIEWESKVEVRDNIHADD